MSKVQGGMKCIKYLLFVFNFMFWLSGSLVLAVGLWLRFDPATTSVLNEDGVPTFFIAVYILIGVGGIMMLVGFFGCCGAVRESQCLLGSFFACLLVIFGAEVAAGVFGFLNKDKIITEITTSTENINININTTYNEFLNCCWNRERNPILCLDGDTAIKDCSEAIQGFFNDKLLIIGYVGIGVAAVMIIGMIFSMVLCCAIRNNREVI
ncbi:tetraspanin-2a [Brachyhypopomus gauderio]|uniref:tetraspanin-2a n=1 Tax=Brachyhypopomus gauderio TaxID=698409 RepID=UPI0040413210